MTDLALLIKKCSERPAFFFWLRNQLKRRDIVLCRIERPGNHRRTMHVRVDDIRTVEAALVLLGKKVTL